jgi:hypothetical protein
MSIQTAKGTTSNGACTSSTRPASPYVGQMIFETDTSKLKVYISGGWSLGQTLA